MMVCCCLKSEGPRLQARSIGVAHVARAHVEHRIPPEHDRALCAQQDGFQGGSKSTCKAVQQAFSSTHVSGECDRPFCNRRKCCASTSSNRFYTWDDTVRTSSRWWCSKKLSRWSKEASSRGHQKTAFLMRVLANRPVADRIVCRRACQARRTPMTKRSGSVSFSDCCQVIQTSRPR